MHLDDEKKDLATEGQDTTPEVQEVKEEVQVAEATPTANEGEKKEEEAEKLVLDLPDDPAVTGPGHSDYNWNVTQKNTSNYTETEIQNYLKDYESSLSLVEESEIVTGIVSNIQDGDVILDIQYKSDGLVPLSEFRDMPDLKIGDPVPVLSLIHI